MIGYVTGTLLRKTDRTCLVLTPAGVGYDLFVTERLLLGLGREGDDVALFVVPVIREDAFSLYGFSSFEERETFAVLISVPKLGPKTALAMLSCFTPEQLGLAVAREDVRALTGVPGIGAKTAKRILLDLKDRFASLDLGASPEGTAGPVLPSVLADTVGGLMALGYSESEASAAAEEVLNDMSDPDAGSAIRAALRILSGSGT